MDGTIQVVGIIGFPVAHSKSPKMHNAAAAVKGIPLVYVPMPVHPNALEDAIKGLVALGFSGANVTVPHKEAVIAYLDGIDPAAQAIGAVNTIVISDELPLKESTSGVRFAAAGGIRRSTRGYNTDWSGFLADLKALGLEIEGKRCLVLGAGGSARAVAYGLASNGARVQIFARRFSQAKQLTTDLEPYLPETSLRPFPWSELVSQTKEAEDAPLIINTTPVGMVPHEDESPWPLDHPFPSSAFVYDLVYNPAMSNFLRHAKAGGCQTANGLGMLLHQGAQAFRLWTGQEPDLTVMAEALV